MDPTHASSSQQQPRTAAQVAADLKYLREQRICEKLEYLVKQLLKQQPEDPVLFVCSQLRERLSASRGSDETSWWLHKDTEQHSSASNEDTVCVDDGGSRTTTSPSATRNIPVPGAPSSSLQTAAHAPSGTTPGATAAAPFSNSLRTSRVTTPAAARPLTTGGVGRGGLERDESAKSDQSYFSIASVDMQEFLSEFRSARNDFLGAQCDRISRNDLAEIVDRVSLPLPDVRLIADLFDEMAQGSCNTRPLSSDHSGRGGEPTAPTPLMKGSCPQDPQCDGQSHDDDDATVPFEAFLARMNFKIQGRYPQDVVRQVYLSMLSYNHEDVVESQEEAACGGGTDASASRGLTNAVAKAARVELALAVNATNSTVATSTGVPKERAISEGLWLGLGIRIAPAELQRMLNILGVGQGDSALLQLTDFSALVAAATGQQTKDDQDMIYTS